MKITVGSTNPTKINAAKQAFEAVFPDEEIEVIGIELNQVFHTNHDQIKKHCLEQRIGRNKHTSKRMQTLAWEKKAACKNLTVSGLKQDGLSSETSKV